MTGDGVAVVAVHPVIGDSVVDGGRAAAAGHGVVVYVAHGGRAELLGAIEERNVTPAVQVVQFGGCEVVCLPMIPGVLVGCSPRMTTVSGTWAGEACSPCSPSSRP